MATVPVHINGKEFHLACDDGQEEQLINLSQEVDDRVRMLSRQIPHAAEPMLLLLVSIMLADELADTKRSTRQLQGHINSLQQMLDEGGTPAAPPADDQSRIVEMESAMAATLEDVAQRIEKIAEQLESA